MRGVFVVIGFIGVFAGLYIYFYLRRVMKFYGCDVKRLYFKIINVIGAAGAVCICTNMRKTAAMAVVHAVVISILLDFFVVVCRCIIKPKEHHSFVKVFGMLYGCGLIPILVSALLFTYGYLNMKHPIEKEYTVKTEKNIGDYTIALLTDTHYGTIQDTDILKGKSTGDKFQEAGYGDSWR